MKLPDVGEGVAEAEIVEWLVAIGDEVTPDSALVEVLTDKSTVEISPPVSGVVVALHGAPGDVLAVGSELVEIDTGGGPDSDVDPGDVVVDPPVAVADRPGGGTGEQDPGAGRRGTDAPAAASAATSAPDDAADPAATDPNTPDGADPPPAPDRSATPSSPTPVDSGAEEPDDGPDRALAAPAVRRRARELDIDLATIEGTGPDGRVVHDDLDRVLVGTGATAPSTDAGRVEHVRGVRRRIADRMTAAWTTIPHITYVEAVDVTELERLRRELGSEDGEHLSILAFLGRAIVLACREQPALNAHYDHEASELTVFDDVRLGIATQTDSGLMVPVVRDAETRHVRDLAAEIAHVTTAARDGSASRRQLSGSTITITSLGALGGIATTPILNPPEVAIIGVNKIEVRPTWVEGAAVPRRMMNLSSSFDHRMVDGWDAATFVQRIRRLLEVPALLFVESEQDRSGSTRHP